MSALVLKISKYSCPMWQRITPLRFPKCRPAHMTIPAPVQGPSDFFHDPAAKGLMSGTEGDPRDQTLSAFFVV